MAQVVVKDEVKKRPSVDGVKRKLEPVECAAGERGGDREEPLRRSDDLEQAVIWSRKVSKNLDWMDDDLLGGFFFLAGRSSTFCSFWPQESVLPWRRSRFRTLRSREHFPGVETGHHLSTWRI